VTARINNAEHDRDERRRHAESTAPHGAPLAPAIREHDNQR
jgi:hypothetical protein